jgi:hypothetical protein
MYEVEENDGQRVLATEPDARARAIIVWWKRVALETEAGARHCLALRKTGWKVLTAKE